MNTKRSTTTKASSKQENPVLVVSDEEEARRKLKAAIMNLSEEEALEYLEELKQLQTNSGKVIEPLAYPETFLEMMMDTVTATLTEQLEKCGAPQEAILLLEDLTILYTWTKYASKAGARVYYKANPIIIDAVASASRNIASVGGAFYSPLGELRAQKS